MREAVPHVHEIRQKPSQDELAYNAELTKAIYRCGNVFSEAQETTFFVNGLLLDIRSRVVRYRESIPRNAVPYHAIVRCARDEGETVRAQLASRREEARRIASATQSQTHLTNEVDGVQVENGQGQKVVCLLTYAEQVSTGPEPVICSTCLAKEVHKAPNFDVGPMEFATIVRNFEVLSTQEQGLVPNGVGTYQYAKRCLAASQATPANPPSPHKLDGGLGKTIKRILRRPADFVTRKPEPQSELGDRWSSLGASRVGQAVVGFFSRLFKSHVDLRTPQYVFVMTRQNYRVNSYIGVNEGSMSSFASVLDTDAGSSVVRKGILPQRLLSQVKQLPDQMDIRDASNRESRYSAGSSSAFA